jgi:outer membrane protein assembly factor BamB
VIVGSNGDAYNSKNDPRDGVYLLSTNGGHVVKHISPQQIGDTDVNGVAIFNQQLYFGNDNNMFYCYDFDGDEIWSRKTGGDVEGAPSLSDLNSDGFPDVVFSTEAGELYALNGQSGLGGIANRFQQGIS